MPESTVSTSIAVGITLGNGAYTSPFTVTSTGTITGPSYTGITDATGTTNPTVYNFGSVHAEYGIAFRNAGTVVNAGKVSGTVGVYLLAGGNVSNRGLIDGTAVGVFLGASKTAGGLGGGQNTYGGGGLGTIVSGGWNKVGNHTNPSYSTDAFISGFARFGVETPVASVINAAGATITGGTIGIYATTLAASIYNAGFISGAKSALNLGAGGYVTNVSGGTIWGGTVGIYATNLAANIDNAGNVYGVHTGMYLESGGSVTNAAGGVISDFDRAIESAAKPGDGIHIKQGAANVYNAGTVISGLQRGIYLGAGGYVTNASTGYISGAEGIVADGSATIVNAGTIEGSADAVQFGKYATASVLSIDPGAAFIYVQQSFIIGFGGPIVSAGIVADEAGDGTLNLAAGTAGLAGTLSGLGTDFTGFSTVAIDAGANWTLNGTNTLNAGATLADDGTLSLGGTFVNDGVITTDPATVIVYGDLTGTGIVNVSDGSTVIITGRVSSGETFDISGGGTLYVENPAQFDGVTEGDGAVFTICYLRGTRILTPVGEKPVEEIAAGDMVVTRFGGFRKVKWVGRQAHDLAAAQLGEVAPVRLAAGALEDGVPARDLYVSPGHSVLVDGQLLLARHLVNGVTVTQELARENLPARIEYFQLDFGVHDCVVAEGAWSESFADGPGLRDVFDNAAEFYAAHPDYRPVDELDLCAPRPMARARLEAALAPVVARATARAVPGPLHGWLDKAEPPWTVEGWAWDEGNPDLPVLLEILLDGQVIGTALAHGPRGDVAAAGFGAGRCAFRFTAPVTLPPDAAARLHIRRACDGAPLPKDAGLPQGDLAWQPVTLAA